MDDVGGLRFTMDEEDKEMRHLVRIKVIGAGGAGGNAINRMIEAGLTGVDFIAVNTDLQDLEKSKAGTKIQIGKKLMGGKGTGGHPERGEEAAIEDTAILTEYLQDADLVFITAGMGGGTGTGSAPVIAQLASNSGALTVAVVTKPFAWEGKKREQNAKYGLDQLIEATATLIVVPNDNLLDHLPENVSLEDAFGEADDVLRQGVQGISDLITRPGDINLDYEDARTVLAVGGKAVMGMGIAAGEGRAIKAAEKAANNPLLEDASIQGARNILVNFTGDTSIGLMEVKNACDFIREQAHPEANLIFGTSLDPSLGDELTVTVVAASFEAPELSVLRRPAFQVAEGHSGPVTVEGGDTSPGGPSDCLRGKTKDDSDPGVVEADLASIKEAKDYETYQTPTWLRKRRD